MLTLYILKYIFKNHLCTPICLLCYFFKMDIDIEWIIHCSSNIWNIIYWIILVVVIVLKLPSSMLNLLFSIIINIEIMLCSENMKIDLCTYFSNNNERTETHTIFKKSFQLSITIMANHHRLVLALTVSITVSKLANLLPAITHSFQINAQNTVETVRTLTLVSRYISKKNFTQRT